MTRTAITMRALRKMSASAIEALPHAAPIKSGTRTVAMLTPLKKPDLAAVIEAEALIAEAAAERSPEQAGELERFLDERDGIAPARARKRKHAAA